MKPNEELRVSLLAIHRRVESLGPKRNFYILLALLAAGAGAVIFFLPSSYSPVAPFLISFGGFSLVRQYFIDLRADQTVLGYFERNHPELCSWLPESAELEAKMLVGQKAL